MALDYNPINFKQVDLRKYHIKDLTDVVKFTEFCVSRLEEVRQVVRQSNNKIVTLSSLNEGYKAQARKTIASYGNPNYTESEEIKVETVKPAEATSVAAEHEALLDELKSIGETADDRRTAEISVGEDVYRAANGKKRVMFYKNGRLIAEDKVPEDTREELISVVTGRA